MLDFFLFLDIIDHKYIIEIRKQAMAFKRSAVCFRLREAAGRGASRILAKAFVFFRFQRFFFRFERTKIRLSPIGFDG